MKTNILDKLRKLQAMAKSGGPEGENAQRLITKLMETHGIDNIEEPEMFRIKCNRRINNAAVRLAHSLGLEVKHYKGKNHQIYVYCTPTEHTVFAPLMAQIQRLYLDRVTAAVHFIEGFTHATYPMENTCLDCGAPENALKIDALERRYVCQSCGWKSRKFQIASDEYANGAKSAKTMIAQR